jgi:hypothetical protein
LPGRVGGEDGVPDHVRGAVEVENCVARFDPVDRDLGCSTAAEGSFGTGHVGRQRFAPTGICGVCV